MYFLKEKCIFLLKTNFQSAKKEYRYKQGAQFLTIPERLSPGCGILHFSSKISLTENPSGWKDAIRYSTHSTSSQSFKSMQFHA